MSNQTNDWSARLVEGAKTFAKSEKDGLGAIARFVRDEVMPYIGMRMQEGAVAWRPDSDEAVKDVIRDMYEAANVESLKGLKRGSTDWNRIKNTQNRFTRGVNFYRATCMLAQRHEIAPQWDAKPQPTFPLDWFVPEGADRIVSMNKKGEVITPTHGAISGTEQIGMTIQKEGAEETEHHPFTISEASILRAYKGKATREVAEDDAADEPVTSFEQAGYMLSKVLDDAHDAAKPIVGDAADCFADIIARMVRNNDLWSLALAERAAFVKEVDAATDMAANG